MTGVDVGFLIAAVAALACAIGVVVDQDPVHAIVFLAGHLVSLAVLYLLMGFEFLGLVQLLVYAGAVMVLFLFVVGLLQSGHGPEPLGPDRLPRQALWGGAAALLLIVGLVSVALGQGSGPAGALAAGAGSVAAFGRYLFGPYLVPFELTALVLLVALVGVVALVRGGDPEEGTAGGDAAGPVRGTDG